MMLECAVGEEANCSEEPHTIEVTGRREQRATACASRSLWPSSACCSVLPSLAVLRQRDGGALWPAALWTVARSGVTERSAIAVGAGSSRGAAAAQAWAREQWPTRPRTNAHKAGDVEAPSTLHRMPLSVAQRGREEKWRFREMQKPLVQQNSAEQAHQESRACHISQGRAHTGVCMLISFVVRERDSPTASCAQKARLRSGERCRGQARQSQRWLHSVRPQLIVQLDHCSHSTTVLSDEMRQSDAAGRRRFQRLRPRAPQPPHVAHLLSLYTLPLLCVS